MKKAEKILLLLLIVSTVLVYSRMPLGNAFFTVISLVVSIYYLIGSVFLFNDIKLKLAFVRDAYAGIGAREIVMSVLAGLSLFYFIGALLFLVNDWPISAAKIVVFSAVSFLILCIVLCAIFLIIQSHATYRRIFRRLVSAVVLLGIIILLQFFRYKYWI